MLSIQYSVLKGPPVQGVLLIIVNIFDFTQQDIKTRYVHCPKNILFLN